MEYIHNFWFPTDTQIGLERLILWMSVEVKHDATLMLFYEDLYTETNGKTANRQNGKELLAKHWQNGKELLLLANLLQENQFALPMQARYMRTKHLVADRINRAAGLL
jgi:hypothetical protein